MAAGHAPAARHGSIVGWLSLLFNRVRDSPGGVRLTIEEPSSWHNVRMPDIRTLTLRQADQARTDFALLESHLEFIAGQLARRPTRGDLA
jgi:hypothetical protein